MKYLSRLAVLVVLVVFVALSINLQAAAPELNKPAPDFTLVDSKGKTHKLSDYKGKYVVLEWINFGCPFVQKHYKGNMQKLQKTYAAKDVVWLSICSSAEGKQGYMASNDEINKKLESVGHSASAYLIDTKGDAGRAYDAKTTPHMYIINQEGVLIYNGAIDSKATANLDDIATADNYVIQTMEKLLAGSSVEAFQTSPYGCSVKY
jgi:peroxiredoxin